MPIPLKFSRIFGFDFKKDLFSKDPNENANEINYKSLREAFKNSKKNVANTRVPKNNKLNVGKLKEIVGKKKEEERKVDFKKVSFNLRLNNKQKYDQNRPINLTSNLKNVDKNNKILKSNLKKTK